MHITLTGQEFNEAITLYLNSLGFKAQDYNIDTRVVVGRGGNETRAEITLEKKGGSNGITNNEPVKVESNEEEEELPFDIDKPNKTTIGDIFNNK